MRQPSRVVRRAVVATGTAVSVAAASLIVWRVLGPAEVVSAATQPMPPPVVPAAGPIGALISAPLVVDDRIRVFAAERRLWADASPDWRYEASAFWSYRRFPAQLVGVAAILGNDTRQAIIVSTWSDGKIVALRSESGEVAWRAQAQAPATAYGGRRTGADTVARPPGLFTARDRSGRDVVAVVGPTHASWFDGDDGTALGTAPSPVTGDCRGSEFTSAGHYLVLDRCAGVVRSLPLASGAPPPELGSQVSSVEPLGCASGHSQCDGMRVVGQSGRTAWLLRESGYVRCAPLAADGALWTAGFALSASDPAAVDELTARDPGTGDVRWTWSHREREAAPPELIGAGPDRVLLLTQDRTLITIDARSGRESSRASLLWEGEEDRPYRVRQVLLSGRYVVLERVDPWASPTAEDSQYYFTARPVLLAGS